MIGYDEERAARLEEVRQAVIAARLASPLMRMEGGYALDIGMGCRQGAPDWWWANITHPSSAKVVHLHLGHDDGRVPDALARHLGTRRVVAAIRGLTS